MKKIIFLVFLLFFGGFNLLFGQFSIYTPPLGNIVNDLDVDNSNKLLVATDEGFLIFDGSNWTINDKSDGLPDNDIKCIATTPNKVYVGTANKGIAYLSSNIWTIDNLNTTASYNYISYIFAKQNGDKYYGTDNGKVFELLNGQSTPTQKNYGVLGRITSIEETNNGVRAILSTNALMLDFSGYLVPINANTSALPSNNVICGIMVENIAYDGTDAGLYIADFNVGPPPTVYTLSTGNSGIPGNVVQALGMYNSNLWVGTNNGLAMKDALNNWTVYNTTNSNLPGNSVIELTIDSDGKIWLATNDGSISSFETSSVSKITPPTQLSLQNIPNPFTNKTIISFSSLDKEEKTIRIFDAFGREVQQMSISASPNWIYEATIDGSSLPNGMYYCKVDGYNETIKMIKIK